MKIIKWLIGLLVLTIMVVAAALLIFFNSSAIQNSLVSTILSKRFQEFDLKFISISRSTIKLEKLSLMNDGTYLEVADATVEYSLWEAIFDNKLNLKRVNVDELNIRMPEVHSTLPIPKEPGPVIIPQKSRPKAPRHTADKAFQIAKLKLPKYPPFKGLLQGNQLPMLIVIDDLHITGKIQPSPSRSGTFSIQGGGIAPGRMGSIKVEAKLSDSEDPTIAEVVLKADIGIFETEDAYLSQFTLHMDTQTTPQGMTQPILLNSVITLKTDANNNENYQIRIQQDKQAPLLDGQGSFNKAKKKLSTKLKFAINSKALKSILVGTTLPEFDGQGQLVLNLNSDTYTGPVSWNMNAKFSQLSNLGPKFANLPNLQFNSIGDILLGANTLRADKLSLHVSSPALSDILSLQLLEPVTVKLNSNRIIDNDKIQELFSLKLKSIQLPWFGPMLSDELNIPQGTVQGDLLISGSSNGLQIKTRSPFTLNNLTLNRNGQPDVQNISLQGDMQLDAAEQSINLNISDLSVTNNTGQTQISLKGNVNMKQMPKTFDFDITGPSLYVDDIMLLAEGMKASGNAGRSFQTRQHNTTTHVSRTAPSTTTPNKQAAAPATLKSAQRAPWADYQGKAQIHIDRVIAAGNVLEHVNARLLVDASKVQIQPVTAHIQNAPISAEALLVFQPQQRPTLPYGLNAKLNLSKFDVGHFLALSKPGETPPLTGLFSVNGSISSTATQLKELAHTAQGDFSLTGGPGKIRALASLGKQAQDTAQLGGLISGIASIALGKKAGNLPALSQLIKLLQEINYHTLTLKARRGKNLNIELNPFALLGPQIELVGAGVVRNQRGVNIPDQPMDIKVALSAKGQAAQLFQQLNLLTGKKNNSDYYQGPNFDISGTPAKPDFSGLNKVISDAATSILSGFTNPGGQQQQQKQRHHNSGQKAVQGLINSIFN